MSVLITAKGSLLTPVSLDRAPETVTVVDGLFAIARALLAIAEAIRDANGQKCKTYDLKVIDRHEAIHLSTLRR